jgi:hypothetical protein
MSRNPVYLAACEAHEAKVLADRAAREALTGKTWWDMPCKRGECPGPFSALCCHASHASPSDEENDRIESFL